MVRLARTQDSSGRVHDPIEWDYAFTPEQWQAAQELTDKLNAPLQSKLLAARNAIAAAASNGGLLTSMRSKTDAIWKDIPASWWSVFRLDALFEWCHTSPRRPEVHLTKDNESWWVFLSREKLNDLLNSPRFGPAQERAVSVVRAEGECQRWFETMMRESPHLRPRPQAQLVKEARQQIEGLSERAAIRAWSKAIVATGASAWAAPGAPKKSPHP
jgi:hypothetical protein